MDPPQNTVSPLDSSDSKMVLGTKEDSPENGIKTASNAKEDNVLMKFWSDKILLETFLEKNYLKKPSAYEEQLIMRMYLRWYMGFEMGCINPAELVCQMALLTPSCEGDKSLFEVFAVKTSSKTRRTLIPVRNVRLPELTPSMLNSYYIYTSSKSNTTEPITELGEKEKSVICSFYSEAKSTLSITEKNNSKRIALKCFLGFSALLTLRLISKQTSTVQMFLKERFGKMYLKLYEQLNYHDIRICAPHIKSLDDVKRGLDLRLPNIKITLHAIILQYIIYVKCHTQQPYNRCILYSLLLFVKFHGLPLVRLYLSLRDCTYFTPWNNQLLVATDKSASIELLSNLFKHYFGVDSVTRSMCEDRFSPEVSWKWCRLLDESYFAELKIESNAQLAYNMAALVADGKRDLLCINGKFYNDAIIPRAPWLDVWNMVGLKNNLDINIKEEAEIFSNSLNSIEKLRFEKEKQMLFSRVCKFFDS